MPIRIQARFRALVLDLNWDAQQHPIYIMPPENLENANDSRYQVHQDVLGGPTTNTGLQRSLPNLTQSLAIPSSKATTAHIPFLDRLRALPEVRPIPWRPGQELGPEKSTESPRVQQRGAILLSTRGHPPENPCASCAAGNGRFSVCVTLEPWFQGACSSCIFTSKGNKCSLRSQTSGGVVFPWTKKISLTYHRKCRWQGLEIS